MYVLCAKVTVKTDEEELLFHYHPVIKNCLLNPDAECNEMVAASDLIELQKIKAQFEVQIYGVEYVILDADDFVGVTFKAQKRSLTG